MSEKQHQFPCGTCPFTDRVKPGELGGSPPEVYVAQHFLPFMVVCHEFIDYTPDDWKEKTTKREDHQCVGFAMCRTTGGQSEAMPDTLLSSPSMDFHGFKDIWDFWAHHKEVTRREALHELNPGAISVICAKELNREGMVVAKGEPDNNRLIISGMHLAVKAWQAAWAEEHEVTTESV